MKRFGIGFLGVAALVFGAGCDRTHLSPTLGWAVRGALREQVIYPRAGELIKPAGGLDSEEAAAIAKTYRKSLSPKSGAEGGGQSQLLILPPEQQSPAGMAQAGLSGAGGSASSP